MKKAILLSLFIVSAILLSAAAGEFYDTGKGTMGKKIFAAETFRNNWTVIITLNLNNDGIDDMFLYDPILGEGEFYLFNNYKLEKVTLITGFRKTWKTILAIDADGDMVDELLFYDPKSGDAEIHKVNVANKTITAVKKYKKNSWRKNWKTFVPISLDADPAKELFLYDPVTGSGEFLDFTSNYGTKSILKQSGFRKNWAQIREVNLNNDGIADLFFYDPVTGSGEMYTLATPLKPIKVKKVTKIKSLSQVVSTEITVKMTKVDANDTYRKNWRTILVGDFGSGKALGDMFLYDPVTGEGEFYSINDKGVLKPIADTKPGFRKNWSIILKGKFSENRNHGLFFYESPDYVKNFKTIFGVNPY